MFRSWLLNQRNDEAGATASLRALRGTSDVTAELREIKAGLARERARVSAAEGSGGKGGGGGSSGGLGGLLKPQTRGVLLLCCTLQMFQQFCGVNAIVYFTPTLLKQAYTYRNDLLILL